MRVNLRCFRLVRRRTTAKVKRPQVSRLKLNGWSACFLLRSERWLDDSLDVIVERRGDFGHAGLRHVRFQNLGFLAIEDFLSGVSATESGLSGDISASSKG